MNKTICTLVIEDDDVDFQMLERLLRSTPELKISCRASDMKTGIKRIGEGGIDLILLDLGLPDSDGLLALEYTNQAAPGIPIIVLTGQKDEATAVEAVKKGAQDYLLKGEITAKMLVRSLQYAIERKRIINELKEAHEKIKVLKGLLPICMQCKKIRDNDGYWNQMEYYIYQHSEADFSHGYCPECRVGVVTEKNRMQNAECGTPNELGETTMLRVLLVEDEELIRNMISQGLNERGYTVAVAETGATALAFINSCSDPLDLLIADVVLPGSSGLEVANAFISKYPDGNVVLMSGYADAILAERIQSTNYAFVGKPFTMDVLLTTMREILDEG